MTARHKYALSYDIHKSSGMERHDLYEGDNADVYNNMLSRYIAVLGMHGWEAINYVDALNGNEIWAFKRQVDPSNQYLIFPE